MTTLDDTMNNAQKLMDQTKDNAGHAATRARSRLLDGIHTAATTITMLRGLGVGDALRWVGLQRRESRAVPLFTFGAGFLAGAAAGVLFAPMAGADIRRKLSERVMGVERDVEKAGADAKARVSQKTDEIAGQAKDVIHGAETKAKDAFQGIETKAKDAANKAAEAVNAGASSMKDAIKSATDGTASRTPAPASGGHQSS